LSTSPVSGDPATNETIRTILEAGALCLARFGQDKTSIQVIADAAGLNRTTVYRYFGDRNQLFNAISEYERDKQRTQIRERIPPGASLEDALATIGEILASTALAFHVPEHLRRHDRGLALYYGLFSYDRHEWIATLVRPYIESTQLAPGLTQDEAVEWAALVLMLIETLPGSVSLDIADPRAVGRTFARRICAGIGRR
jgi:TetR/AcrR family transcriptional regulator, mexJK operon transcriptional repressor